jgi:parallel beta-helix repeat protein
MAISNTPPYPFVWDGTRRVNPNDWNNLIYNLTGSQIKSGSFQVNGPVYISGSLVLSGSTNIGLAANINVGNSGIIQGTQNTINFVSGSGINLTVANNPTANRVDVTLSTGSGVGGGGGVAQAYTTIQNQGIGVLQRNIIDFTGSIVAASDDSSNSRTLVSFNPYGVNLPSNVTIGNVGTAGVASSISRSDHAHPSPINWTPTTHAQTHYVGGSDPLTGSLALTGLSTTSGISSTGNITGSTISGSALQIGGISTFGGIISGAGGIDVIGANNIIAGTSPSSQTSIGAGVGTVTIYGGLALPVIIGGNNNPITIVSGSNITLQTGSILSGVSSGSTLTPQAISSGFYSIGGSIPNNPAAAPDIHGDGTNIYIEAANAGIYIRPLGFGQNVNSSVFDNTGKLTTGNITGNTFTSLSGSNIIIQSGSLVALTGSSFVLSGSTTPNWRLNTLGKVDWLSGIGTNLITGSVVQANVKFGAPTDSDFINPVDGLLVVDNQHNTLWERASGAWIQVTGSSGTGSVGPHTILSTTHTDTVPAVVVAGDLMVGNDTPAWTRFPIGTAGKYIASTGSGPVWSGSQNIYIGSSYIGNGLALNFATGSGINITGSIANNNINLGFNTGSSVATLISGLVPTNELGTGAAAANVFLRGDQTWSTPPSGVSNVRYASIFASSGTGTSGSPWLGWDNVSSGVFANMPALPQPVTVIFEPGWFQTATGSVLINRSYVSIAGYGPESNIQFPGYGTGLTWAGITGSNNTGSYSQIAISGLHLIGDNLNDLIGSYQTGMFLSGVYDFWISGNWVELFGNTGSPNQSEVAGAGIYIGSGSKRGHVIGNRASKNKLAGISINGNNVSLIDGDYTEDIEVTGNITDLNHRVGIHLLNDVRGVTITSNICSRNEFAGISLENTGSKGNELFCPKYCTVESNTCYRNTQNIVGLVGGYGIDIHGAQDCIIKGNLCNETSGSGPSDSTTGVGIRVFANSLGTSISRRNLISNNTVENNQGSGIRLETSNANFGPTNSNIVNNIINGNGLSGAGLGVDIATAGTAANSGSVISNNNIFVNTFGAILPPSGLINTQIKDNIGYNPTIANSLNFVTSVTTTKNGIPSDSDFINPQDGQLAVNVSANSIYFRSNALWRQVTGGGGSAGGVANVRYASTYATTGSGTSGSPWSGWDNTSNGVFAGLSTPATVVFEPGWFQASTGTVNVSLSNITVAGFGAQSIIKFSDYGDGLAWYGNSSSSGSGGAGYRQILINGLHLIGANLPDGGVIGTSSETHQIGLRLEQVYDFWVSGNYIELFGNAGNVEAIDEQGDGICCIDACQRGQIIGNRIEKCKISGIFVQGLNGNLTVDSNWAEDIDIIGNISQRNHHSGIHLLDNTRNCVVDGNICNYNEGRGIILEDVGENSVTSIGSCPSHIVVSNNNIFYTTGSVNTPPSAPPQGGHGIDLLGAQDCIITGNHIHRSWGNTGSAGSSEEGSGISLQGYTGALYVIDPSRNTISNNLIENTWADGIFFDVSGFNTGSQIQILNNIITNPGVSGTGYGIEIVNTGSIAFSGSTIKGNIITLGTGSTGAISLPAGAVSVIVDDNRGYNPAPSSASTPLNFISRVVTTKSGKPTDADFVNPQDGQVVIDISGFKEYVRIGGLWHTGSSIT